MDAAHDVRPLLGQALVEEGILTTAQLTEALRAQYGTDKPLGEVLVSLGFVSDELLANALSEQQRAARPQAVADPPPTPPSGPDPLEPWRNAIEQRDQVIGRFRGELEKRDAQIAEVMRELAGAAERVAQLESAPAPAEGGEQEIAQLREELEQREGRIEQLAAELEDSAVRVAGLETQLREHELAAVPLRDALAERESLFADALARVEQVTADADALHKRLAELQAERDGFAVAASEAEASAVRSAEESRSRAAELVRTRELESSLEAVTRERDELAREQAVTQERIGELEEARPAERHVDDSAHVLFLPSRDGYRLIERMGAAPAAGEAVEVDGIEFVVERHGISPLPGSKLRCAFLRSA